MKTKGRKFEELNPGQAGICPYLGLLDDADSVQDYPSANNVCHHVAPLAAPTLTHQSNLCLTTQYAQCRVYNAEHNSKLPAELTIKQTRSSRKALRWAILGLAAVAVFLAGIILLNNARTNKQAPLSNAVTTPTNTAVPFLLIGDATKTPTHQPTPKTATATQQPTESPTPELTRPPHTLDVVIGVQDKFIIHRVSSGESIQLFATQNNTTPNVIKSVNHNLVVPIWVDSIIVIPLDRKDPGDLPAFEPYGIADRGLTLQDLAEKFNVDLEILSKYNDLLAEDELEPGEWVLIPRERTYWYRY